MNNTVRLSKESSPKSPPLHPPPQKTFTTEECRAITRILAIDGATVSACCGRLSTECLKHQPKRRKAPPGKYKAVQRKKAPDDEPLYGDCDRSYKGRYAEKGKLLSKQDRTNKHKKKTRSSSSPSPQSVPSS